MQPIQESLRTSIDNWLVQQGGNVSIRLEDLGRITTGQLVLAWLSSSELRHPYRICLLADTRGQDALTKDAIERAEGDLKKRGATLKKETIDGQEVHVYTMPTKPGHLDIDQVAYCRADGRLIISDRLDTVKDILAAIKAGGAKASVLNSDDYAAVQKVIGDSEGHLRWFARPLGMGRIARDIMRQGEMGREDIIGLLERQGFDVIKSAGGVLRLDAEPHDLLHKFFIYAPKAEGQDDRFRLAARMLTLPNSVPTEIPDWIKLQTASVLTLNWRMEDAFWASESLVDEILDSEGIFRDTLQGIIDDPTGPQVDIAKDIIGNLENHLYLISDNTLPATVTSERLLLAVPLKNTATVSRVVQKTIEADENAFLVEHPNSEQQPIWEIRPAEELDSEELKSIGFGQNVGNKPKVANDPILESWAITVYKDHLLLASHTKLLLDVLKADNAAQRAELAKQEQTVVGILKELTKAEEFSMLRVIHPALAYRVKYDLLRTNQLKNSDSVLATLLRRGAEELEKANSKAPKAKDLQVQGSKLPEFSFVAPYLGEVGTAVQTTDDGWQVTSVILSAPNAKK